MIKSLVKITLALVLIAGLWATTGQARDVNTDAVAPVLCSADNAEKSMLLAQSSPCPGGHGCITSACGVMSGQVYCCPSGHRYLNHCDCLCYTGNNFNCNSYSYCNQ